MSSNTGMSSISSAKPDMCKQIIAAERAIPELGLEQPGNRYKARAQPNERLVIAFGIENCFVMDDQAACENFREGVEKKLYFSNKIWADIAKDVKYMVDREIEKARGEEETNLTSLVQRLTMKAVMRRLFDRDMRDEKSDQSISDLASEINKQWIQSKGDIEENERPAWAFENQTGLQAALKAVFPDWDGQDRKTNPLNLILPGYETMWRVVLRCFVEIFARHKDRRDEWCEQLQVFANDPCEATLSEKSSSGLKAKWIPMEALRLYPPTRRVHREYQRENGSKVDVAANIESMHHDETSWGQDALLFKPERWASRIDSVEQNGNWMPFSVKNFTCPARRRVDGQLPFAISMIILLVNAMFWRAEFEWKIDGELPQLGEPLDPARDAYSDLVLRWYGPLLAAWG